MHEAIELERLLIGSTRSQSLLELQISRCREGRIDIQAVYDAYQTAQDNLNESGALAGAAVVHPLRASFKTSIDTAECVCRCDSVVRMQEEIKELEKRNDLLAHVAGILKKYSFAKPAVTEHDQVRRELETAATALRVMTANGEPKFIQRELDCVTHFLSRWAADLESEKVRDERDRALEAEMSALKTGLQKQQVETGEQFRKLLDAI